MDEWIKAKFTSIRCISKFKLGRTAKREALLLKLFTGLGLLFLLAGVGLFGIIIMSYHFDFTPPAWLAPQPDATNIGIHYFFGLFCMLSIVVYWWMFIKPRPWQKFLQAISA